MRRVAMAITAGILLAWLAPGPATKASEFDKKTILTFSGPFQIPGAVMEAGTYVVERALPGGNPDVVRFLSSNERHIYATVMAIPTERMVVTDKPKVVFAETRAGSPEAIKEWYYPGDQTGEQFVYPKGGAVMMASATDIAPRPAPESVATPPAEISSAPAEPEPAPESNEVAMAAGPELMPTPSPEAPQTATEQPAATPSKPATTLPQTASNLSLLALLGTVMLGAGVGAGFLCNERSE